LLLVDYGGLALLQNVFANVWSKPFYVELARGETQVPKLEHMFSCDGISSLTGSFVSLITRRYGLTPENNLFFQECRDPDHATQEIQPKALDT
ncbi:hypothetical protein, partial [Novacetimonas hansenii]|uniref:hypothetical protein n=1 Tax=Novacetimonas hansenii TaxID=436 RepID=UPI001C3FE7AC